MKRSRLANTITGLTRRVHTENHNALQYPAGFTDKIALKTLVSEQCNCVA